MRVLPALMILGALACSRSKEAPPVASGGDPFLTFDMFDAFDLDAPTTYDPI